MDPRGGLFTPNVFEADTNTTMLRSARRDAVFVADHTKWGIVGVATFAPLRAADALVTDDARRQLLERVGSLLVGEVISDPAG